METKKRKLWLKIPLIILASLLAVILIYVAYVVLSYQRIEDDQQLTIEGTAKGDKLRLGTDYTAVTYNIGFGANHAHTAPLARSFSTTVTLL